jgi:hypothetical protein
MAATHVAAAAYSAVIVVLAWAQMGSMAFGSIPSMMPLDTLAAVSMIPIAALAFACTSLVAAALQVPIIAVALAKPSVTSPSHVPAAAFVAAFASSAVVATIETQVFAA